MAFAVIKDLLGRRVPQILGLYLGAGWVIVEFVNLLVDRFALSPHLIEFCLVVLASLIPTVMMLAYFHGRPGRNDWATLEKVGIPANLLAAAMIVGFFFSDKHLGAATTTVMVETEEGRTVERVIPKSEFRKKVALFYFDNESGDTTLDWLSSGMVYGLQMDLMQDLYVQFSDQHKLREEVESAEYPEGRSLPRTLKANIASRLHQDYFIDGSFTRESGALAVTASVYETRRQKLLARNTMTGDDVLGLIDRLSVQLRRDLGIPDRHIEDTSDLRIADLLTHSRAVFELQARAFESLYANDWGRLMSLMERAVELDPTSAISHYFLSIAYLVSNRKEEADREAERTMEFIYRLPELWQYYVKLYYYDAIEEDARKRFAVAKLMVDLYPDDIEVRVQLAEEYLRRDELDKAIAEYESILEIDPTQYEYLRSIGYAYRREGKLDQALEYFQRYAKARPGDYAAFQALGDLYAARGEHALAEEQYERAQIVDPENVDILNRLGTVAYNQGRLDESRRLHERSLELAKSARERAAAYAALSYHHQARHYINKAIEYKELEWAEREKFEPRPMVLSNWILQDLELYVWARRADRAFEIIRDAERELAAPFTAVIPSAYLQVYLELEDTAKAAEALAEVERLAEERQLGFVRDDLLAARGWIEELRGDCRRAIESYEAALKLEPQDVTRHRSLGRCYRKLGRLAEAEAELRKNLKVTPYNPKTHYELALVYADRREPRRAVEHLRVALRVLEGADSTTCETLQKARAKLAELEAT